MLPLRTRVSKVKAGAICILVCLICIFSANSAVSQTNLPNPIRLGIRTAAFPIGYVKEPANSDPITGSITTPTKYGGFCDIFRQELEGELERHHQNIKVSPVSIENQYRGVGYPRFDGLLKNTIDVECGPNSISSLKLLDKAGKPFDDNVAFAKRSFYTTGIKLLLKVQEAKKLYNLNKNDLEESLRNLRIGVVKSTTTLQQFEKKKNFYQNYIPFDAEDKQGDARDAALDALEKSISEEGSIQAFASDAVILQTLLKQGVEEDFPYRKPRDAYAKKGYTLFPRESGEYLPHLEREYYGIAIQKSPVGYSADALSRLITSVLGKERLDIDGRRKIADYEEQSNLFEQFKAILPYLGIIVVLSLIPIFWYFKKRSSTKATKFASKVIEDAEKGSYQAIDSSSGQSNYQFVGDRHNVQINHRISTGIQNNAVTPEAENALNDLKKLIAGLQQRYPRASEQEATAIIGAEFKEIQHNQPERWQNLLNLKRLWNGVMKGSLKAGEHFAEETPWGKAVIGFIEGVTDDTN